jgi:hypothetical protein
MPYLNITNPFDRNKTDWIQIPERNRKLKSQESKVSVDPGGFFASLQSGAKIIDAGELQQSLNAAGITVSTDPKMTPNGVTVSSAGILIALEEDLKPGDLIRVYQIIANLAAAERTVLAKGGSEKQTLRQSGAIE